LLSFFEIGIRLLTLFGKYLLAIAFVMEASVFVQTAVRVPSFPVRARSTRWKHVEDFAGFGPPDANPQKQVVAVANATANIRPVVEPVWLIAIASR
jgi:hypothetical protein